MQCSNTSLDCYIGRARAGERTETRDADETRAVPVARSDTSPDTREHLTLVLECTQDARWLSCCPSEPASARERESRDQSPDTHTPARATDSGAGGSPARD